MTSPNTKKKTGSSATSYAYQRIEQDIREKVRDGRLPAGAMLASRHNLAREYGVSLATAQQAVANLIAEGTLEASDRRGTFVARTQQEAPQERLPVAPVTNGEATRIAEGLSSGRTAGTLGIVATANVDLVGAADIGSLWARQAIRSLEQVFSAAGGTVRFFDRYPESLGPYERGIDDVKAVSMTQAIETLRAEGAAALAIVGLCDGRDMSDEIVAAVDIEHMPVVYISWHEMRPPLAQVYYDNTFAGYQAAQHLLRKGYSRLLFLSPFQENWLVERIGGAADAVRHTGLPPETLRVCPGHPMHGMYIPEEADDWAYEVAREFFAEENMIFGAGAAERWGIIAPNDLTAYAVQRAASEQGKIAGVHYGLVGFDDDPRSCALGLTTVRPPVDAMGEEAGRVLLRALHGERSGLQVRLRSQVIPRASTDSFLGAPSLGDNKVSP